MHLDSTPILDVETLGEIKLSNLSHNTSSKLVDATGVCTPSTSSVTSSNSNCNQISISNIHVLMV